MGTVVMMHGLARRCAAVVSLLAVGIAAACSTVPGTAAVATSLPNRPVSESAGTTVSTGLFPIGSGPSSSTSAPTPSEPAATTTSVPTTTVTTRPETTTSETTTPETITTVTTTPLSTRTVPTTSTAPSSRTGGSTGAAPGSATEVIEFSPLAAVGKLAAGLTAQAQPEPISGCFASPVSRSADVYQCGPSAAYAPACWPKDTAHVLCMAAPQERQLREYATDQTVVHTPATAAPLPWMLELANGARCSIRIGGAWGGRADGYAGAYSCTGGVSGNVVLVPSTSPSPIDDGNPLWTVPYGPLGPNGTEKFPAPQHVAVRKAWFAVNRTPGIAAQSSQGGGAGGNAGTPVNPDDFTDHAVHNFKSPSGNVYCELTDTVRCAIFSYDFTAPTPAGTPSLCPAESARAVNQLMIDAGGRAGTACNGDPGEVHPKVLPSGSSLTVGQFRCLSAEIGVDCRSTRSGHGFTVSRAALAFY